MEIFGIGPIELLLILILSFIVFGPERLPEIGRLLGRLVARVLAWQHQSPEARMIQEIRRDFQREIIELRDEIVRAQQQLNLAQEGAELNQQVHSALSVSADTTAAPTIKPSTSAKPAVHPPRTVVTRTANVPPPPGNVATEVIAGQNTEQSEPPPAPSSATMVNNGSIAPELATLAAQLQALQNDVAIIQAQLRRYRLLDPPPSTAESSTRQEVRSV